MKNIKSLSEIFLYGFYFLLFLRSCSSPQEKALHKVHTVEIKQMQFQPAVLQVQKGDTVVFINRDIVAHNVTEVSNKAWSSSPLATDSSWKFVANKSAGYYCTIHPVMKGKLIVQ